ncbi:MAG: DegT/DnrJ/EryC1/StrS family aminotransferase [Deltaproteobacteria bacterium]|nr:DegT/DnrJ/EryC1/StrS family aminotransferase [Deltaproteobacteria bacterium]
MTVPLFDLSREYRETAADIDALVRPFLAEGRFFDLTHVKELEAAIAPLARRRHAVGVASGTDALVLALMALELGPGDEVITTPLTFYATAAAIARVGARPVFADIDPRTYTLDPARAAAAITPRTRAILPVDLYGQVANLPAFEALAKERGLALVADCAQSLGAALGDRPAGAFGHLACFSFHVSKNLGAWGDAGMLVTDDDALARTLRVLRNHGSPERNVHTHIALKSHLDPLQAAVLRAKLPRLEAWSARRAAIAARYDAELGALPELVVPHVAPGARHVYHKYTVQADARDALMSHLWEVGVQAEVYYAPPLHLQPCFTYLGHRAGDLPVAEAFAQRSLCLPVFPQLTDDELTRVVAAIRDFYARRGGAARGPVKEVST